MATKFYKCRHCGNVVEKVVDSGVGVVCCGEQMQELIPNTVEASGEKHIPVVTDLGNGKIKVKVGSEAHPMLPEHFIEWIAVETESGYQIKYLKPNDLPKAEFKLNEEIIGVYAYCNLHGLWKA